jgi:AcrR family transcriptional regulator
VTSESGSAATRAGQGRRTRLSPARRRRQIIEAAGLVFEDADPLDVTFEEVAEAAGVSRGLVYRYFGDKGGLMAAVYLSNSRWFDAVLHPGPDGRFGRDRVQAMVEAYFHLADTHAGAFRRFATLGTVRHPKVAEARAQRLERVAARWNATPDGHVLAVSLMSLLEGVALDWLGRRPSQRDAVTVTVTTLLWDGIQGLSPP